jgi:glycosyltransferase involved in cell wall biosynthesis
MKILLIRNAFSNDFGGAETYAYNLAQALITQNRKVLLVSSLQPLLEKCRTNVVPAKKGYWNKSQHWTRMYYIRYILTTLWYCWLILRHRVDVVNPQGRDDFIFATNAAWLLRKRVIWTDHGDLKYILDRVNHPNPRLQRWVLRAASKAAAIICVSDSEKKAIEQVAPELHNLVVVHNGVFEPEQLQPVPRPDGAGLIVGTNARLVKAKGIMELLEGFAGSAALTKKDILWIVGSEDHDRQRYYDRAAALKIQDRVKFWGYVTNPNDYVATMDIFVHASYHEAFSLAVIEAAMLGKAIIATAVGGTPEIINKQCGLLIKPRSSQAISQALDTLASNKQLRTELGEAARETALTSFNFDVIVKNELLPLYEGGA